VIEEGLKRLDARGIRLTVEDGDVVVDAGGDEVGANILDWISANRRELISHLSETPEHVRLAFREVVEALVDECLDYFADDCAEILAYPPETLKQVVLDWFRYRGSDPLNDCAQVTAGNPAGDNDVW
jgi:hypothetical protein